MSRLGDWLDERTGHRAFLHRALDVAVPGGARFAYVWGSALAFTLVLQAVTGILLSTAYANSATTAWSSVAHITLSMRAGWLIRGLHHFGAQAMIVLLAVHLVQTAVYGAYRRPREVTWLLGLALAGLTLGFIFTGPVLAWDQRSYWASRVEANIIGTLPVVGPWMQGMLQGGPSYGHLTLTRFYSLHVAVLPMLTGLVLAAHWAVFRRHGVTPAASADTRKVERYYPQQVVRALLVGLAVLVVVFALTAREHGAPLDSPADPTSDYPARPAWYFRALFQLRKYLPPSLEVVGVVGLPLLFGAYLVALPFLDRKPGRSLLARLPVLVPLALALLGAAGMTVASFSADARDADYQRAEKLAAERAARALVLFREGVPPEGPLAMLRNDPETRGADLFQAQCASCHRLNDLGPPKEKMTGPDLTGFGTKAWALAVLDNPDADHLFGKTPFKGQMPSLTRPPSDPEAAKAFTPMSTADQDAVAEFLVAQARGERAEGTVGEKLVRQRCTSCHRLDGKVDDEESAAPELRGWASLPWIEAQIANPGSGKAYPPAAMAKELEGHMPRFEDKISEKDRKILAAWMQRRGLSQKP